MKKIWICGALGMLGSHFKRSLEKDPLISFVATDYQEIDITQLEQVSEFVRMQQITHILNCAAYTQVDRAEEEEKQAYIVNAIGPHNLSIASRRHGARLIHFSTDYVFDGEHRKPYTEQTSCNPIGAYGRSKLAGEIKILNEYEEVCIIRTSWLFGFPGINFVSKMLQLMYERDTIAVVSDQVGRPTYCGDLVHATLNLLEEKGIYHFANASETSWYLFAEEILKQAKQLGYPLKTKIIEPVSSANYKTNAKRPFYSTLNTSKIEKKLPKSLRTWKEALKDYLVYFLPYFSNQISSLQK